MGCARSKIRNLATAVLVVVVLSVTNLVAEQVPVRFKDGVGHGFLVIRDLQGKILAMPRTGLADRGGKARQNFRKTEGPPYLIRASKRALHPYRFSADILTKRIR